MCKIKAINMRLKIKPETNFRNQTWDRFQPILWNRLDGVKEKNIMPEKQNKTRTDRRELCRRTIIVDRRKLSTRSHKTNTQNQNQKLRNQSDGKKKTSITCCRKRSHPHKSLQAMNLISTQPEYMAEILQTNIGSELGSGRRHPRQWK